MESEGGWNVTDVELDVPVEVRLMRELIALSCWLSVGWRSEEEDDDEEDEEEDGSCSEGGAGNDPVLLVVRIGCDDDSVVGIKDEERWG